jgi:hypothetical protein
VVPGRPLPAQEGRLVNNPDDTHPRSTLGGWIKLHRSLLDCEIWSDINTSRLWIYCLLRANFAPVTKFGKVIPRGSFLTGRYDLAKGTGLTEKQIRLSLQKLNAAEMIEILAAPIGRGSLVTICNYDIYESNFLALSADFEGATRGPVKKTTKKASTEAEFRASIFDASNDSDTTLSRSSENQKGHEKGQQKGHEKGQMKTEKRATLEEDKKKRNKKKREREDLDLDSAVALFAENLADAPGSRSLVAGYRIFAEARTWDKHPMTERSVKIDAGRAARMVRELRIPPAHVCGMFSDAAARGWQGWWFQDAEERLVRLARQGSPNPSSEEMGTPYDAEAREALSFADQILSKT